MRCVALSALLLLGALVGTSCAAAIPPTPSGGGGSGPGGSHTSATGEREMHAGDKIVRTTGASGWIQFCDASANPSGPTPSKQCVNIRPFGFFEADVNDQVANAPSHGKRRINNLYQQMSISNGTRERLPLCSEAVSEASLCGATADGVALEYTVLPITVDLSPITTNNAASLRINVKMFEAAGYFRYHGENYTVSQGMAKFDIDVLSYDLAASTNHVGFRLTVQSNGHRGQNHGNATNKDLIPAVDGVVENLPRYAASSSAGSWSWKAADVEVDTEGTQTVINYKFHGPFTEVRYDPIIASDTIQPTTAPSPAAPLTVASAIAVAALFVSVAVSL